MTGATSGIGEQTALGLARLGARVVLVGRHAERGRRAREAVAGGSGNPDVDLLLADFASLAAVRALAREVLARYPELHVLVNNAGVVHLKRTESADGFEATLAVNHLAPFLLSNLLLERLAASAPARIVNVASEAHRFGRLDLDDLQSQRRYKAMRVYGASKLANVLFSYELARRVEGRGIAVHCLHPGAVATRLGHNNGWLGRLATAALRPFFLSPERGAETSIYAASSPELEDVTGRYYVRCREKASSAASHDADQARRLWDESSRLTGLG